MPRKKALFPWERHSNGMVQVDSKAYGKHHRNKRGTHKPAGVNDSFKEASKVLLSGSGAAKLIKDALDPFRKNFYDGSLWSRLLSHFYKELEMKQAIDFRSLEAFGLYKGQTLSNVLGFELKVTTDPDRSTVKVHLANISIRISREIRGIDAALVTPILVFVDECAEWVDPYGEVSVTLDRDDKEIKFEAPVPPNTGTVLVCIKCEGSDGSKVSTNLRAKGMDIVKALSLGEIDVV
jgi:hypothetical protein